MVSHLNIQLPASLEIDTDDRAEAVLRAYFAPVPLTEGGFTGGRFDAFNPSGLRSASEDVFTADDVIAVSLLSVHVSAAAAIELLERQRPRFSTLLAAVGDDRDLVEVESTQPSSFPADALYWALRELPDVGPTTATKLMARKRPRLIPIIDSVINEHVLGGTGRLWEPLRLALRADHRHLHNRLLHLRSAADLSDQVSALRVFDVLAWMDGSGHADRIIGSATR